VQSALVMAASEPSGLNAAQAAGQSGPSARQSSLIVTLHSCRSLAAYQTLGVESMLAVAILVPSALTATACFADRSVGHPGGERRTSAIERHAASRRRSDRRVRSEAKLF